MTHPAEWLYDFALVAMTVYFLYLARELLRPVKGERK